VRGVPTEGVTTVRVHALNPLRDLFQVHCQGKPNWTLDAALKTIAASERGVLVWISQGEQVDFGAALDALQQPAPASSSAHYRSIGVGAQILRDLGVQQMRLLSSPLRFNGLSGFGLEIVDYVASNPVNV